METDWIRRLKQDDETALCEIIRKYTGYVYTILRNFSHGTLPQEDLEELTADVFLRLWNSRNRLRDGSDLAPYLAAKWCEKPLSHAGKTAAGAAVLRRSHTVRCQRSLRRCRNGGDDRLSSPCTGQPVRTGSFSDDTVLFLWRKNLCTCKDISHDRCRGTAPAAPQQRETPEADDRKGF